jgi:hypothetical protein
MLYQKYFIQIWKIDWVNKTIDGVYYSLSAYNNFRDYRDLVEKYKYIALVWEDNPLKSRLCCGGSTPLIALDLAKFSRDLDECNRQRRRLKYCYLIVNKKVDRSIHYSTYQKDEV